MHCPVKAMFYRVFLLMVVVGTAFPAGAQTGGACPAIVATRPSVVPPQRFRAGDVVPVFALDAPLQWAECPAPEFPAGAGADAKRRVFLFVTVDENGAVADVKPRGAIDPEGYFDAAVAAVRRWKSTAPRWKSVAVRCAFAADIVFDRTLAAVATPAAASSAATQAAQAPPIVAEKTEAPQGTAPAATRTPEKPLSATAMEQTATPPSALEQKPAPIASAPPQAPAPDSAAPPAADPKPAPKPPVELPPPATASPALSAAASEPADSCPQFFVLPAGPNPRTYRAGDMVPNSSLDVRPVWVRCPWPDFAGIAARTAMVIAVIDEAGSVREVRPRGHRETEPVFLRAKAALLGWRVAPAPRHRGQPVLTTTAIDIATSGPPGRTTSSAASNPLPAPAIVSPEQQREERPQPAAAETPFAVEYYYKAKWGFADEFWRLFLKNHWPILRKQMETGRILEVRAAKPVYHATEDGRWDYRVTIVFRSASAANAVVDTAALERQLFPDQETFRREEQRRFELLLAHWDVPVAVVPLIR